MLEQVKVPGRGPMLGASASPHPEHVSTYNPVALPPIPHPLNPEGVMAPPRGISPRLAVPRYQIITYASKSVSYVYGRPFGTSQRAT